MSGERFTSWLAGDEREALRELARELGTSENYLVRVGVRALLFGKPIPAYIQDAARTLTSNRSNTSNAHNHVTGARS